MVLVAKSLATLLQTVKIQIVTLSKLPLNTFWKRIIDWTHYTCPITASPLTSDFTVSLAWMIQCLLWSWQELNDIPLMMHPSERRDIWIEYANTYFSFLRSASSGTKIAEARTCNKQLFNSYLHVAVLFISIIWSSCYCSLFFFLFLNI